MVTVVQSKPHAVGVLTALRTLEPGIAVGDGVRPAATPSCVLDDIGGGALDGPVSDSQADAEVPFQVRCIGRSAEEARWVADKVRAAVVNVTVAGRVMSRPVEFDGPGGQLNRDDDAASPSLYGYQIRFRLHTTPA